MEKHYQHRVEEQNTQLLKNDQDLKKKDEDLKRQAKELQAKDSVIKEVFNLSGGDPLVLKGFLSSINFMRTN